MTPKPLYICDIDGTVADSSHRAPLLEAKDYETYYGPLVLQDPPILPVIRTIQKLYYAGADIWFFSGRNERCRDYTLSWLRKHVKLVKEEELTMRGLKDFRVDDVVKQDMLHNMLPSDLDRLVGIFDDRQRVVDMWRRNGITCFQVAEGDY